MTFEAILSQLLLQWYPLHRYHQQLTSLSVFDKLSIESMTRAWLETEHMKLKDFAPLLRAVLTGQLHTPPLFDVMEILGQAECVARIETAIR